MVRIRGWRRARTGFSLVEMAIATLLVAIFLTLGLGALNVQQENLSATTTQKNLDAIKDAFINYVRTNKRLPCPDTDPATSGSVPDGRENPTGGTCTTAFGVLPYLDLGLTRETALDGWGNLFSYHVSTSTTGGARNWSTTGPFVSTGNPGALTVEDRNTTTPFALYPLSTAAVAVVVSHGRNGLGAYTTKGTRNVLPDTTVDEYENTNGTTHTTYIRRTRTDSDTATGGMFDDYVMYLSAEELLGPLVKDGSIKWADVQISDDFERVKNAVVGYAMATINVSSFRYYRNSDCATSDFFSPSTPPYCRLLPANLNSIGLSGLVDPLGVAYTFTLGSAALSTAGSTNGIGSANAACSATGVAFTLKPSGSLTPTYDETMYCSELRAALGSKIP